jgi:hypothetical protein
MAIYLHPIDEKPDTINQEKWVEIDLVSWSSSDDEYPIGITLLRRLNIDLKQPYLQELMFAGLHKGLPIKQLVLEIPNSSKSNDSTIYTLNGVKVLKYSIFPPNSGNKQAYEKIVLHAKYKTP